MLGLKTDVSGYKFVPRIRRPFSTRQTQDGLTSTVGYQLFAELNENIIRGQTYYVRML